MDNIKFDFHMAKQQEQKLHEICLRLENLIHQEYDDSIMEIRRAWEGNECDSFFQKMCRQREKMVHTSVALRNAEEALKEAEMMAEITEEKAKETAENRTY